jgi:hypothetical protein
MGDYQEAVEMTLDDVNRWRGLAGKAAALFCIIFFLSVFDGLISLFQQSPNDLRLLPGTSVKINGPAKESIRDIDELEYASTTELIQVSFEAVHSGYWMGGRMWRGVLTSSPNTAPGEYGVTVRIKGEPSEKPMTVFRVRVFGNSASLQENSDSIIQRYTGCSPWWIVAPCFILVLLLFGIVYLCSQKREESLRHEGKAEIYRISKTDVGYEISFALGTKHGVQNGSRLKLLDADGIPIGIVKVEVAYEADSTALSTPDIIVKPGYMVLIER